MEIGGAYDILTEYGEVIQIKVVGRFEDYIGYAKFESGHNVIDVRFERQDTLSDRMLKKSEVDEFTNLDNLRVFETMNCICFDFD